MWLHCDHHIRGRSNSVKLRSGRGHEVLVDALGGFFAAMVLLLAGDDDQRHHSWRTINRQRLTFDQENVIRRTANVLSAKSVAFLNSLMAARM